MAEPIEHTPYSWCVWHQRLVLFKRYSLRVVWGILLYVSSGFAIGMITPIAIVLSQRPIRDVWEIVLFCVFTIIVGACFSYVFYRCFKAGRGFDIPVRLLRLDWGNRFACETFRDPRPTGMGGTLPGYPVRWLVVRKANGKTTRLVQVHEEPDLLKINCALAGRIDEPVRPSR
ncbi:MAG: hypothetical protein ACE37H_17690 [Phycisphaeraceae bacterium]